MLITDGFLMEGPLCQDRKIIKKIHLNMSYMSFIGFTLKMEFVAKNTKMMVKNGVEKIILKSLHAGR